MKKSINIPLQDQAHTNKHHYVPKHVKINIPLCECTKKIMFCAIAKKIEQNDH